VTDQELVDIFRVCYPEQLKDADFKHVFQSFAHATNRLLINYKQLTEFVRNQLKGQDL